MIPIRAAYDQWAASYDHDENWTRDLDKTVMDLAFKKVAAGAILELGCGTGKNTSLLAQIGRRVHAIDFSARMIAKAKSTTQANNVIFSEADIVQTWPIQNHSVDLIVCNLVLEHIEGLSFVFAEAARSLRPGGVFYISELHPNRQVQGRKARFLNAGKLQEIPAFVHHLSDFMHAAQDHGLVLLELREWRHDRDQNESPRLITFRFQKQ